MTNSAQKGRAGERELRDLLDAAGYDVRLHGIYEPNDLTVDGVGIVECKVGRNKFKTLYKLKGESDVLILKEFRKPWLIVMELEDWLRGRVP